MAWGDTAAAAAPTASPDEPLAGVARSHCSNSDEPCCVPLCCDPPCCEPPCWEDPPTVVPVCAIDS